MNELEKTLYRKKRSLRDVCLEFGIDVEDADISNLESCSNCSIWHKPNELVLDLDGNPICKICSRFYGM